MEPTHPTECSLESLREYANIPVNIELVNPSSASASAGGGGGGSNTTILSKLPPSSLSNRAELWALEILGIYMNSDERQHALAELLYESSRNSLFTVRDSSVRAIDPIEWRTGRNWADNYMYRVCTFFYDKQTGKINLPTKYGRNITYNTIYANHNMLPTDFVMAIIILKLSNLYKISDPALDRSMPIRITIDLYFNRQTAVTALGFHKDSGTNPDVVQTPSTRAGYAESELLNYASLLFLSQSPILRGTAFMQTQPFEKERLMHTRTACTLSLVPLTSVIFNDRLLQHATPHPEILEVSETLYHQTPREGRVFQLRKRWDDLEEIALRDQEEASRTDPSMKISRMLHNLKPFVPKPFVHISKNIHTFTPELKRDLESIFLEPRAFLRGHYSFEPFELSQEPLRPEFTNYTTGLLGFFTEKLSPEYYDIARSTVIPEHIKRVLDNRTEILAGIRELLDSKDDSTFNKNLKFYNNNGGQGTIYIRDSQEIDEIFKTLNETILGLGKQIKKRRRKTYKRTKINKRRKTKINERRR
jgi:hypothetical protein